MPVCIVLSLARSLAHTHSLTLTLTLTHTLTRLFLQNASSIKLPFKTEFLALVLLFAAVYYSFVFSSQSFATSQ